jgi:hypothetical protein
VSESGSVDDSKSSTQPTRVDDSAAHTDEAAINAANSVGGENDDKCAAAASSSPIPPPFKLMTGNGKGSHKYCSKPSATRVRGAKAGGVQLVKPAMHERRMQFDYSPNCCKKKCINKTDIKINEWQALRAHVQSMKCDGAIDALVHEYRSQFEEKADKLLKKKHASQPTDTHSNNSTSTSASPSASTYTSTSTPSTQGHGGDVSGYIITPPPLPEPNDNESSCNHVERDKVMQVQLKYMYKGQQVCRKAFMKLFGYSRYQMQQMHIRLNQHAVYRMSDHKFEKGTRMEERTKWMIAYLNTHYNIVCDTTSNDDDPNGKGHWYLPAYLNLPDVHRDMCFVFKAMEKRRKEATLESQLNDMQSEARAEYKVRSPPSFSHFLAVNLKYFAHVREPTRSTYGVCETCLNLGKEKRNAMSRYMLSTSEYENVQRSIVVHRESFITARKHMRERMLHASTHPHQVLYLGVDYTVDFDVPSFRPHLHMDDKKSKLQVKTGGIINFSTNTNYVFGHWDRSLHKGSNLVCTALWHIIRAAKMSDHPCGQARKLQIQSDGGTENSQGKRKSR